ncbi:hypothetical protein [Spirulina sp. 06S082]|uniref:hypothetical protein n=1 Tax=Spirulina sp. 06S082 TaxID=3110248 RepID=UPI002B209FA5|nr:hypothetical protein [Spirulina sp. 06S082]MEA5468470.1 hypothetical protein [Spirulina sp. 06S082]
MMDTLLDKIGDWNPQLLRELKGRLTPKNIIISIGISAIAQILLFYLHLESNSDSHVGVLYLFITLSIVGIISLLVVGIYFLIEDLYREEKQGTLNFVRLSPQTSKSILLGKILGVPILVYLAILSVLPLHFGLGIYTGIPVYLIVAFYSIVAVNCFLFYSAALLLALVQGGIKYSPASLGSVLMFGFSFLFALKFLHDPSLFPIGAFNWFALFYPGYILPYLVNQTPYSFSLFDSLSSNYFSNLTWFDGSFWSNPITACLFTLISYSLVISWLWNGLDRRFHNRSISPLSKTQSYWLSGSIMVILIGFSIPNPIYRGNWLEYLFENFSAILILQFCLFCGLMGALSPHRKTLQNWSRYRHQKTKKNLLWDLIWGEESPATLAIALNLLLTSTILLITILLLPLGEYRLQLIISLLVSNGVILLYASLVQWILLQKFKQRVIVAIAAIAILSLVPALSITSILPEQIVLEWVGILLSVVGQSIAIALINLQMARQLRHLGKSEMQELLSENSRSKQHLSGMG